MFTFYLNPIDGASLLCMGMNSGKGVIHLGLSFIGCVIQTQSTSTPGTENIISLSNINGLFSTQESTTVECIEPFPPSVNNARAHAWRIQARINPIVYIAIIDIRYPSKNAIQTQILHKICAP